VGHLRRSSMLAAAALAVVTAVGLATPAQAANVIALNFNNVTGTIFLAKPNVTATVPTSVINSQLDLDTGALTGQAHIPDTTVHLSLAGVFGVTSVVRMIPAGDLTGTVNLTAGTLSTTTRFTIQVLNVHLDLTPAINLVPSSCRTSSVSTATLVNTTPIDLINGTTVSGTFTIPSFTRCGALTPLLTLLLSAPNNRLTLILK
jgi:hypothetical protein